MKRKNPISALFAAVALAFAPAQAQDPGANPARSQETGVITGTVINVATGRFLERATVEIEGTQIAGLTDRDGRFRLVVPAGPRTVIANYTELDETRQTVVVPAGGQASVMLEMSAEVYELDPYVVSSAPEGNAFVTQQQRRAESVRTITSVDAFIDITTGNPGEFLKNLQGIQMDYSQNEPQVIRVRGFDPNLTMVTMDGNEVATAASSGTNRAVQIDQLSIANISSVEVYKAPIPSGSANAIGGSVNFTTQSAFDQKGRRAFIALGVTMDSHEFFNFSKTLSPGHGEKPERRIYPVGRFSYSDSYFDNRLGVMFSMGRDHTNQLASSVSHSLNVSALPGTPLPAPPTIFTEENARIRRGTLSFGPNRQLRTRDDISLNLDFKVSDSIVLFLKSTLSDYHSTNRNHSFARNAAEGSSGTLSADSTLRDYTYTAGNGRVQVTQGVSVFDKYTTSWNISPGLKFRSGDWKIDLIGGFSKSINHYNNADNFGGLRIGVVSTTDNPVSWRVQGETATEVPTMVTQLSGPSYYDLDNYQSTQGNLASTNGEHRANHNGIVENRIRDTDDVKYSARFDVQRDFQWRVPFYLKAGVSYNDQIRDRASISRRWYWMGEDGVATADDLTAAGLRAGRFREAVPIVQGIPGWNLREPDYFDTNALWRYWQDNPQVLQENLAFHAQQKFTGRQKIEEEVTGAYLMGNFTFNKLNVLTGLRSERTKIRALTHRVLPIWNVAWETDGNPNTKNSPDAVNLGSINKDSIEGIGQLYRWFETDSSYTSDPFPYLHLRYEVLDGLQLRASYTEGIGRPNLSDVIPRLSQSDVAASDASYDGTISVNRVGLEPQRSQNLDFSVEYYTRTSGQFSAGWFSRDVEDYISSVTTMMTPELLDELDLGDEYSNYRVTTKRNLGSAKWSGFELSFRQGLRAWESLPKVLQGFEVWGNYTKIYQMEGDFGTPGARIEHLANVVDELYNAGISYRAPGGKLNVNLTTNYQAPKPRQPLPARNTNGQRMDQQNAYQFWNLEVKYRISPKVSFTCVGRNIGEERGTFSEMGIIRNKQQATGIAWVFTTRMDF